ncbi:deoxycytidine triphosphate deaminase [Striga asiatica]|uniref:Deoxycytidine triphosphate deaminase n=1 Tax=Striga asiatica TaxID=4170 RepID=A0A5A7PNP0_STRAF|nr:deoxycytidine triphosphate deaminase [Striga asiatica]
MEVETPDSISSSSSKQRKKPPSPSKASGQLKTWRRTGNKEGRLQREMQATTPIGKSVLGKRSRATQLALTSVEEEAEHEQADNRKLKANEHAITLVSLAIDIQHFSLEHLANAQTPSLKRANPRVLGQSHTRVTFFISCIFLFLEEALNGARRLQARLADDRVVCSATERAIARDCAAFGLPLRCSDAKETFVGLLCVYRDHRRSLLVAVGGLRAEERQWSLAGVAGSERRGRRAFSQTMTTSQFQRQRRGTRRSRSRGPDGGKLLFLGLCSGGRREGGVRRSGC